MTNISAQCSGGVKQSAEKNPSSQGPPQIGGARRIGLNVWVTALFLTTVLSGAGYLALPRALANTGWLGIPLMIVLCISLAFSGTRLGHSWVILEERWPSKYSTAAVRQPYLEIAYCAYGKWGRILVLACILFTLLGSCVVFIILISQFLNAFFSDVPFCLFVVLVTFFAMPFTWLGTPKDFWQGSILAVTATVVACVVVFIQLILDVNTSYVPDSPVYRNPTFISCFLGFGTILAAFGGASVFPTIQNDMADRTQFWKSVSITYIILISLYLPVSVAGYSILGFYDTPNNILLYRGNYATSSIQVAILLQIINLFITLLVCFNPVCQTLEEAFNIPIDFGWRRCSIRASIMLFELIVALAIPDFGLILNLTGGSTITICSLILPPLMYMRLCDDKSNKYWPERSIPTWQRIFSYEIVAVGIMGGLCATGSALYTIATTPFSSSCFLEFFQ